MPGMRAIMKILSLSLLFCSGFSLPTAAASILDECIAVMCLDTQWICMKMGSSAFHGRAHRKAVTNTLTITTLSTANRLKSPLFLTLSLLFLLLLFLINPVPSGELEMDRQEGFFLYFAYGSNLLKERLQLKNPSATIYCVARLKDYTLVFGNYKGLASQRWQGGVATIEPSPGDEVWGVVWRMNMSDLESLDRQENVKMGIYSPMEVSVSTSDQGDLNCRTYIMNSCIYAPPSPQYLKVIVMGAEQNGLPEKYQQKLRSIQTNKFEGRLPVMEELEEAIKKSSERTEEIESDE